MRTGASSSGLANRWIDTVETIFLICNVVEEIWETQASKASADCSEERTITEVETFPGAVRTQHGVQLLGHCTDASTQIERQKLMRVLLVEDETRDRRASVGACLSALLALATAVAISTAVFHARPFMDGLARNYLHQAAESSFPSDHATVLFALPFSMLLTPLILMRWTWLILLTLALVVGWARIYLGAHLSWRALSARHRGRGAFRSCVGWPARQSA